MAGKKIYHYSHVTGELIGEGYAKPSPLEPGAYLIPAFSTEVEPPKGKANKVPVFNGATWELVDDYRGTTVYNTQTGTPLEITALGSIPDGYTTEPQPDSDHVWKGRRWVLDKAKRAERLRSEALRMRSKLLQETDWVVVRAAEDGQAVPEELKHYRQKLRDITRQPGFPEKILWPKKPDNI